MSKKRKLPFNRLSVKIILTVIIGIFCLAALLSVVNIAVSKDVFVENFSESQKKAFLQIDEGFYDLFSAAGEVAVRADTSWAVRQYLTEEDRTAREEMEAIYYMKVHLKETRLDEFRNLDAMILGMNGKSYLHNSAKRTVPVETILESRVVKNALKDPGKLVCEYAESGYTDDTKNVPVILIARTLDYQNGNPCDGIVLFTIKESEFEKIYDYFTSETNDIVILNQEEQVISSNNEEYLNGEKEVGKILKLLEQEGKTEVRQHDGNQVENYLSRKIQGTNFQMLGIIDPEQAFLKQYNFRTVVLLTSGITVLIVTVLFVFVRQQTKPLSRLVRKMRLVQAGNLKEFAPVEGTEEIQELSKTYNRMLEEINRYIEERMKIQEEKRNAEIHALQMQINPHYMYNTLASIKWLIWQGDAEKSTKVIDAFISLLRNTISNKEEFVTVAQEIENLKNYVLINQTRYGNRVGVEFYVAESCKSYKLPKLILQPFVENAFFHAFPEGMSGEISVFIREEKHYLRFEIVDNGVGMDTEKLHALQNKTDKKSEHFTGIGINNVDDRIKLIYGMDYGINITSEKEQGTTVTVLLPKEI